MKFNNLIIKEICRETADCVSILFEVPEHLATKYNFVQGQYLTLKKTMSDGEEIRRSYSICSSPVEGELRVAIKEVEGGKFSTFANRVLQKGDILEVMPPMGKFFTTINSSQSNNYVAFAAGSGITPIMSILKTVLLAEPKSSFTLVYGNKNTSSVIFKEQIEGLKNRFLNRLTVYYVLSRERQDTEIFNGRIDEKKCHILFEKLINIPQTDEFFLCGPSEMINDVRNVLEKKFEVSKSKIHFELFGVPTTKVTDAATPKNIDLKPDAHQSEVSVRLDGVYYDFKLSENGENILDAAMRAGADLPFACKGGVCCTCRAKVTDGSVRMDVNYALEAEELSKGFILACQAHPTSSKVALDFDTK